LGFAVILSLSIPESKGIVQETERLAARSHVEKKGL
jgi:hypothetical protein